MKIKKYFRMAKLIAYQGDAKNAKRQHRLGAVGLRNDGVIVGASNLCNRCNMITPNSVIFVVRINRKDEFVMAKPCQSCQRYMKVKGVRRCYYSTDDGYGVIKFN